MVLFAKKLGITQFWGSIEAFLDRGFGYCIVKSEEIISACYSIYVGREEAEIDMFTDEKYRGKGLGQVVASSFMDHCISNNINPYNYKYLFS